VSGVADPKIAAPPAVASPAVGDTDGSDPSEHDFSAMEQAFLTALEAAGEAVERSFAIGGEPLRVVTAGPALSPVLFPALAHLESAAWAPSGLRVLAFDSASTGVAPPPDPLSRAGHGRRVTRVLQRGARLFTMLHRERRTAVVWTEDAAAVPANEVAAPLRMLLHLWLADHGWQVTHGAAVGSAAGGVLIGGASGSGKSTTALAAVEAGLDFAGDDYVLVRAGSGAEVCSLFASAKLLEDQLARFPDLADTVINRGRETGEKPVLLLGERFRGRLVPRMSLRAVVIPRVTGTGSPRLRAVAPGQALASLAPSTIFQLPFDHAGTLRRLGRLVGTVPSYELEAGPDLEAVGREIRSLLESG
jgi:hypothetical protein